ncbi:MAG: DUF3422 domain-containing protein [Rhizobiaceae bacterium]
MSDPDSNLLDIEHRHAALAEAHARPPLDLTGCRNLRHFALRADAATKQAILALIKIKDQSDDLRFVLGTLDRFVFKLEHHTEFITCTFVSQSNQEAGQLESLAELIGQDLLGVICDIKISFIDGNIGLTKSVDPTQRPLGGQMRGMEVRTTLQPDDDLRQHFTICAANMSGHELGRRVQRLLEMETYRVLTLMGLEACRASQGQLVVLEEELDALVFSMTSMLSQSGGNRTLINRFSTLATEMNTLRAATRFRISASRAYCDIAVQRLASLDEEPSGDLQTITGFVRTRLDPAIATINSFEQRLDHLANEISNALSLLRTHIEVETSQANQQNLQSLNERHRQQLLISQTVEGLSIVAISYYSVGLLSYVYKAMAAQGWLPLSLNLALMFSVPLVIGIVGLSLRRLRKHWA